MSPDARVFAVLTGDLVGSSKLSPAGSRRALDLLAGSAREFGTLYAGAVSCAPDTFRHDSWQWLLERPELALRAALFLRVGLKMESEPGARLDTRIAIGLGPVEQMDRRRVSNSRGPAFTDSGRALDGMGRERIVLAGGDGLEPLARGAVPLLDCLVTDWTATESRAIDGALRGWTQEETARHWPIGPGGRPISRQAVGKSLQRSRWYRVAGVLDWCEAELARFAGGAALR